MIWKILSLFAFMLALGAAVLIFQTQNMVEQQTAQLTTMSQQLSQLQNQVQQKQATENKYDSAEHSKAQDFGRQLETDLRQKLPEVQKNVEEGLHMAKAGVSAMLKVIETSSPTITSIVNEISKTRADLASELPKLEAEVKKLFQKTQQALQNQSVESNNAQ